MDRIGKYDLIREVGRGGMGMVYQARDRLLGRIVAVKLMTGENLEDEVRERFYREARAAGNLKHPNIVTIHDLNEENGTPYIVMEFLEGMNLRQLLRTRKDLAVADRLLIGTQIAKGLAYAHHSGVIHRDVKPENIWVDNDGEVKLLDFGLARFATSEITRAGMVMGSVPYMSPEQTVGKGVDHRTDIWALGVVIWEMLARRRPFDGETVMEIAWRINNEDPPTFQSLGVDAPAAAEATARRALQKDPEKRYGDAAVIARELSECRSSLLGPYPTPAPAPAATPEQIRRAAAALLWPDVVRRSRSAILQLTAPEGTGTAFVVAPGSALTCRHLVLGTMTAMLKTESGKIFEARVMATDQPADLALLQWDDDIGAAPLRLAVDGTATDGHNVILLGFADGATFGHSDGVVQSALKLIDGVKYVQTDITLHAGQGGGPVLTPSGEVVAIANPAVAGQTARPGIAVAVAQARALLARKKVQLPA